MWFVDDFPHLKASTETSDAAPLKSKPSSALPNDLLTSKKAAVVQAARNPRLESLVTTSLAEKIGSSDAFGSAAQAVSVAPSAQHDASVVPSGKLEVTDDMRDDEFAAESPFVPQNSFTGVSNNALSARASAPLPLGEQKGDASVAAAASNSALSLSSQRLPPANTRSSIAQALLPKSVFSLGPNGSVGVIRVSHATAAAAAAATGGSNVQPPDSSPGGASPVVRKSVTFDTQAISSSSSTFHQRLPLTPYPGAPRPLRDEHVALNPIPEKPPLTPFPHSSVQGVNPASSAGTLFNPSLAGIPEKASASASHMESPFPMATSGADAPILSNTGDPVHTSNMFGMSANVGHSTAIGTQNTTSALSMEQVPAGFSSIRPNPLSSHSHMQIPAGSVTSFTAENQFVSDAFAAVQPSHVGQMPQSGSVIAGQQPGIPAGNQALLHNNVQPNSLGQTTFAAAPAGQTQWLAALPNNSLGGGAHAPSTHSVIDGQSQFSQNVPQSHAGGAAANQPPGAIGHASGGHAAFDGGIGHPGGLVAAAQSGAVFGGSSAHSVGGGGHPQFNVNAVGAAFVGGGGGGGGGQHAHTMHVAPVHDAALIGHNK